MLKGLVPITHSSQFVGNIIYIETSYPLISTPLFHFQVEPVPAGSTSLLQSDSNNPNLFAAKPMAAFL